MQPTPDKVIAAVLAHPDDAELTCFGTLLEYVRRGYHACVVIVCTGEHGVSVADRDRGADRLEGSLRFRESLAAFAGTGVDIEGLGYEDSNFSVDNTLVSTIERRLRSLLPEILIAHYVDASGVDHQDHGRIARACLNIAVRCPSIRLILQTEPLQHVRCGFVPNWFVDVTDFFDRKVQALEAHKSQRGRAYLTREYHLVKCRNNALAAGTRYYEEGRLFEAFQMSHCVDR